MNAISRRLLGLLLLLLFVAVIPSPAKPAKADSVPSLQSGAIAEDGRTGRVYLAQPASDSVFVLAAGSTSLLAVLRVPAAPSALALDSLHGRIYVASDAAGLVSAFDTRTYHLIHVYSVGGHPAGLFLTGRGKYLDIADGAAGTLSRLTLATPGTAPAQMFNVGPATAPTALLSPHSAALGSQAFVWAHGFNPGEPVAVSWGVRPLARGVADAMGVAMITFHVPAGTALGNHLVIVQGQWPDRRTSSGLVNVIPAPPVRPHAVKRPARQPKAHATSLLKQILAPAITLPLSLPGTRSTQATHAAKGTHAAPAGHASQSSNARHAAPSAPQKAAGIRIPIALLTIVLLPLVLLALKMAAARRRRARNGTNKAAGKRGKRSKAGAPRAPTPLKKAS